MSARHRSPVRLTPREHFKLFAERTEELSRMRILSRQGLTNEWSISAGRGQPLVFRAVQPDEDDLRSYLLAFRKFVSEGEPVYWRYILGLCLKHFTSDNLKARVRECQQGWKEDVQRSGIRLTVNGRELLPEYLADLWINGHYFHDDPEKMKVLQDLVPAAMLFARPQFLNFVSDATRVILASGHIIKVALREDAIAE